MSIELNDIDDGGCNKYLYDSEAPGEFAVTGCRGRLIARSPDKKEGIILSYTAEDTIVLVRERVPTEWPYYVCDLESAEAPARWEIFHATSEQVSYEAAMRRRIGILGARKGHVL